MSISTLFANLSNHLSTGLNFSEALLDDGLFWQLAHLDFSESGLKVKRILESVYLDGITGLEEVKVEGQNIVGVFLDYVSPTLTRRFNFIITPNDVSYQMVNTGAETQFSEYLEFVKVATPKVAKTGAKSKATKSGKARQCTEGKSHPCGATCISVSKKCKQPLSENLKDLQQEIVSAFAQVMKDNPARDIPMDAKDVKQTWADDPTPNQSKVTKKTDKPDKVTDEKPPVKRRVKPKVDDEKKNLEVPVNSQTNVTPKEIKPPQQVNATLKEKEKANLKVENKDTQNNKGYANKYAQDIMPRLQSGEMINLSDSEVADVEEYVKWLHSGAVKGQNKYTYDNSFIPKANRIAREMKESGNWEGTSQNKAEAFGLASYLHGTPYSKMNALLWRDDAALGELINHVKQAEGMSEDDFIKQYAALDYAATNALRKLPEVTNSRIREQYKGFDVEENRLRRHMSIPEGALSTFLDQHKAGETIRYDAFTSTTVFVKDDATPNIAQFSKAANIKMIIERKPDGETSGKLVDHFKNHAVEGEILFPPGTQFAIDEVSTEEIQKPSLYPFSQVTKRDAKKIAKILKEDPAYLEWYKEKNPKVYRVLSGIKDDPSQVSSLNFTKFGKNNINNMLLDQMEKVGVKLAYHKATKHIIKMREL